MRVRFALLIAVLFAASVGGARAAPSSVAATEHTRASLVAATSGWTPGSAVQLGLRLQLGSGWHTYWSNPGDAGLAPDVSVAVDGSPAHAAKLRFPAPERLPTGPLMGYGYTGDVLLPFTVTPTATKADPLRAAVHADWLVCASVCVPEHADLALVLPQTPAPSASPDAMLFARAEQAMPRSSPFSSSLSAAGVLRVGGEGISAGSVASAWFIPDAPGLIDQDALQTASVAAGALTLTLHPQPGLHKGATLSGILALKDRAGQETDLLIAPRFGTVPVVEVASGAGLPDLLLLALVGGLVLNLMPCVFPILAMKAIAFGRHGPDARGRLRRSAALYTAGILGSFLLIGIAIVALRSAGGEIGWGFQFQSPVFVAAVAWLLFAVGLNLTGLFEVGATISGAGQGLAARGGAFGDLMTGVLAVLVATPCTAPFMGAAVAAALSGPPPDALAIFLALGLGLALPSLVLGFVPGAARMIPRPGAWMSVARQVLSFPMFAAAVWLIWVLSEEAGPPGVLAGLSGLLLIGFGGWLYGLVQRSPSLQAQTRRGLNIAAVAVVLAALSILPGVRTSAVGDRTAGLDGAERFSPERLASLRGGGRPVFVDMSAAWCITCLVNERLALAPASVRSAFASAKVTLLRGNWTERDTGVTAFLHQFGRDGVPLYVFFPAHDAPPQILPQVLTPGLVIATVATGA